jgi:putative ABC transport system permease protein
MRNLVRHPIKALLSAFGISLSVVLLFIGFYFFDAIRQIIRVQFEQVQREDVEVTFNRPLPGRVAFDLGAMQGVSLVEPYRVVPARLKAENRSRRVGLTGLAGDSELRRVVDKNLNRIVLPPEGIVLGRTIADSLGVEEGAKIIIEVTEGSRPVRSVVVAAVVSELIGLGTYMDLDALNRLMREDRTVSGAFLMVDSDFSRD